MRGRKKELHSISKHCRVSTASWNYTSQSHLENSWNFTSPMESLWKLVILLRNPLNLKNSWEVAITHIKFWLILFPPTPVFLLILCSVQPFSFWVNIAMNLQQLLNIVESKSKEKGLELNSKKTEVMVISRKEEPPLINVTINGIYLGALVSSEVRNDTEISARIAQAKTMFQKVKKVLTNSHILIQTRKRTLECYIEPILMYGWEAWTLSKQAQKKLEAVEMWFLRRMLKISWMAKKSNDTVLKEAHTSRALVNKVWTRQTTFFGHVMRREKLEHLITTGMMEGKRSRGKQGEKMTDGLANWLGAGKVVEILKATRDC